jgi:hypothetical protein
MDEVQKPSDFEVYLRFGSLHAGSHEEFCVLGWDDFTHRIENSSTSFLISTRETVDYHTEHGLRKRLN